MEYVSGRRNSNDINNSTSRTSAEQESKIQEKIDLESGIQLYKDKNYIAAFDKLKPLADDANNPTAIEMIGHMYYFGDGVHRDYQKAMAYYQKVNCNENDGLDCSANAGSVLCHMGEMYDIGYPGVTQDYKKAFECYEKAAKLRNCIALIKMGIMYQTGHGVAQSYKKALECYYFAIKSGEIYLHGEFACKDYTIHHKFAACRYAAMFHYGLGVQKDEAFAQARFDDVQYYSEGMENNLLPHNIKEYDALRLERGKEHLAKGEYQEAVNFFTVLAQQGHEEATHLLELLVKQGFEEAALQLKNIAEQALTKDKDHVEFTALNTSSDVASNDEKAPCAQVKPETTFDVIQESKSLNILLSESESESESESSSGSEIQCDMQSELIKAANFVATKKFSDAKMIYSTLLELAESNYNSGQITESHRILDQLLDTALHYVINNKINSAYDIYSILEKTKPEIKKYYQEEMALLQIGQISNKMHPKLVGILKKSCSHSSCERKMALAYLERVNDLIEGQCHAVRFKQGELVQVMTDYSPEEQYHLGLKWMKGEGVERQSYKTAITHFKQAAEKGHIESMFLIGECHMLTSFLQKDPVSAKIWYAQAAKMKHPEAAYKLAELYEKEGKGSRSLFIDALENAANLGYVKAQQRIADMNKSSKQKPVNNTNAASSTVATNNTQANPKIEDSKSLNIDKVRQVIANAVSGQEQPTVFGNKLDIGDNDL